MSTFNIEWHWLVPYGESLIRQEYLRKQVYNGKVETIILAEHLPTVTLGKRGGTIFNLPQGTAGDSWHHLLRSRPSQSAANQVSLFDYREVGSKIQPKHQRTGA